jgi:hypothetical protein
MRPHRRLADPRWSCCSSRGSCRPLPGWWLMQPRRRKPRCLPPARSQASKASDSWDPPFGLRRRHAAVVTRRPGAAHLARTATTIPDRWLIGESNDETSGFVPLALSCWDACCLSGRQMCNGHAHVLLFQPGSRELLLTRLSPSSQLAKHCIVIAHVSGPRWLSSYPTVTPRSPGAPRTRPCVASGESGRGPLTQQFPRQNVKKVSTQIRQGPTASRQASARVRSPIHPQAPLGSGSRHCSR